MPPSLFQRPPPDRDPRALDPLDGEFRDPVAPPEDNPLRGWRRIGAELIFSELWPRTAVTNPVMVYYTGRTRGRVGEDLLGLAPWGALLALHAAFMFGLATDQFHFLALGLLELIPVTLGAAVWTGCMVGWHLRRCVTRFHFDDLMATPLTSVDLVQGLSIRPMAVQASAYLFFGIADMALAIAAGFEIDGAPGVGAFLYCVLLRPAAWWLMTLANELGGACGLRAHLCLRSPGRAFLRILWDFALALAKPLAIYGTLFLLVVCLTGALPILCIGGPIILLGLLLLLKGFSDAVRDEARDAMEWCTANPDLWWARTPHDPEATSVLPRPWARWPSAPAAPAWEPAPRDPMQGYWR